MKTLIPFLLLGVAAGVLAGDRAVPNKQDVSDAFARAQAEAKRVDRRDLARQMDNALELARQNGPIRLDDIVRQHNQLASAYQPPQRDLLMVFVSLSMPRDALLRVAQDANRAGGVIAFRGFHKDKLSEMHKAIQFLADAGVTDIRIDPQAFKRYEVSRVPTYLVARVEADETWSAACKDAGKCGGTDYIAVSGDVTLDYALDHLHDRSPSDFHASLAEYLRRLGR